MSFRAGFLQNRGITVAPDETVGSRRVLSTVETHRSAFALCTVVEKIAFDFRPRVGGVSPLRALLH